MPWCFLCPVFYGNHAAWLFTGKQFVCTSRVLLCGICHWQDDLQEVCTIIFLIAGLALNGRALSPHVPLLLCSYTANLGQLRKLIQLNYMQAYTGVSPIIVFSLKSYHWPTHSNSMPFFFCVCSFCISGQVQSFVCSNCIQVPHFSPDFFRLRGYMFCWFTIHCSFLRWSYWRISCWASCPAWVVPWRQCGPIQGETEWSETSVAIPKITGRHGSHKSDWVHSYVKNVSK